MPRLPGDHDEPVAGADASRHERRREVRATPTAATPGSGATTAATADPAGAATTATGIAAVTTVRLLPWVAGSASGAGRAAVRGQDLLTAASTVATAGVAVLAVLAVRRAAVAAVATRGSGPAAAPAAGGDQSPGTEDARAPTASAGAVLPVTATAPAVTGLTLASDANREDGAGGDGERSPRASTVAPRSAAVACGALSAECVDLNVRYTSGHGELLQRVGGRTAERRRSMRGRGFDRRASGESQRSHGYRGYQQELAQDDRSSCYDDGRKEVSSVGSGGWLGWEGSQLPGYH